MSFQLTPSLTILTILVLFTLLLPGSVECAPPQPERMGRTRSKTLAIRRVRETQTKSQNENYRITNDMNAQMGRTRSQTSANRKHEAQMKTEKEKNTITKGGNARKKLVQLFENRALTKRLEKRRIKKEGGPDSTAEKAMKKKRRLSHMAKMRKIRGKEVEIKIEPSEDRDANDSDVENIPPQESTHQIPGYTRPAQYVTHTGNREQTRYEQSGPPPDYRHSDCEFDNKENIPPEWANNLPREWPVRFTAD